MVIESRGAAECSYTFHESCLHFRYWPINSTVGRKVNMTPFDCIQVNTVQTEQRTDQSRTAVLCSLNFGRDCG